MCVCNTYYRYIGPTVVVVNSETGKNVFGGYTQVNTSFVLPLGRFFAWWRSEGESALFRLLMFNSDGNRFLGRVREVMGTIPLLFFGF